MASWWRRLRRLEERWLVERATREPRGFVERWVLDHPLPGALLLSTPWLLLGAPGVLRGGVALVASVLIAFAVGGLSTALWYHQTTWRRDWLRYRKERASDSPAAWWGASRVSAPPQLAGLWFGVTEIAPGRWQLTVSGSNRFDPTAPSKWATARAWSPGVKLTVPGRRSREAAVAYAAGLVRSLEPWAELAVTGVAVGIDDGTFEVIYDGPAVSGGPGTAANEPAPPASREA